MTPEGYTTWLEIDLSALRNNVSSLHAIAGTPLMAVVKANAYGHGVEQVSLAALQGGAQWLGVARFEEAVHLRNSGIQVPILVMGYTDPIWAAQAAAEDIRLCLYDEQTAQDYASMAAGSGRAVKAHVKIDTGMGRLGKFPQEGLDFVRYVCSLPGLEVEGLFTHFARADEQDSTVTEAQLKAFTGTLDALTANNLRPPVVHACNSAATLKFPAARFDLVRCGIAIYGLDPSSECPLPDGFRPVLTWKAVLASVRTLPPGHGVGYGHEYITTHYERIGTIPVGYADGLRRKAPNEVLIRGVKLPLFSRDCMDQAMLSLEALPEASQGDEVVLIGRQAGQRIRAEDVALRWNTNNYEVATSMAARLPRIYLNQD